MPSSFEAFTNETRPLALLDAEPPPARPRGSRAPVRAQVLGAAGAVAIFVLVLVLL